MFADLWNPTLRWPLALDYLRPATALLLFVTLALPTVYLGLRSLAGQSPARKGSPSPSASPSSPSRC